MSADSCRLYYSFNTCSDHGMPRPTVSAHLTTVSCCSWHALLVIIIIMIVYHVRSVERRARYSTSAELAGWVSDSVDVCGTLNGEWCLCWNDVSMLILCMQLLSCSHCSGLVVQVDFLFVWCFFLCNICVRVCNWECVCNYCDAYNTTARLDVYIIYYCDASNWMSVCWALISLVISLDIKYIWVVVSQLLSWNLLHRQCSRAYTTSFHLLGIKQTPSLNWERWYKYSTSNLEPAFAEFSKELSTFKLVFKNKWHH